MNDKIKFSPEQLVSSTQLVRNLSQQLEKASKYPLFIQRNQEVDWVLLSIKEYERIVISEGRKKK